jgi:ankyrin repeat protein
MSFSSDDIEAVLRAVDRATEELGFCRNRVWAIAKSLRGGPREFPKLLPSIEGLPHEAKKEDHQLCTFDFCEQSRVNFTLVTQRHEPPCDGNRCPSVNFPSDIMESAVREEQQTTAWDLRGTKTLRHNERYMAISHVWSDGTGAGSQARGHVNSCLLEFFQNFAVTFNCEGIWWDTICIPTKKALREKALKRMQLNYKAAAVTLVHDCFLRECEWRDADLACFYIVMSPWFSRGWTALELQMSQNVQIIFKGPQGPITKDLDKDILQAKSNIGTTTKPEVAKDILKRLRGEEVDRLDHLLAVLGPRHTSWPRDMAIISGLMIGIQLPENYAHQKIYQEVLQKLGKISHAHLFHNSATMTHGYNWCPTNIYDLPVTLSANTLQIEENGNLFGEWNIMSLDHIKDESVVLGHAHPLIEGKARLAQKEKDQHMLLVEPDFTLGRARINRGLLVKPLLRRDKIYLDCYCDYIGPIYFHPPLISSEIPNFDPNLLFKVHVGNDETTHNGSHQRSERRQRAQDMIEDMKNGSLHPQYRKRESDMETLDVTTWDELKLSLEFKKAAADGDYENTEALLEKVRDPNHSDESGWSALHHAVWSGQTKVAKLLVKSLNLQQQTARGEEPLHLASERGNKELVLILLKGSTPNLGREDGLNALHLAAMGGFSGIVDEMLSEHWEINATDPTGQTALHMASARAKVDVVHALTKQNADHGLKDNRDRTALSLAVFGGHESTAKLLRNAGADPNGYEEGFTLLRQAVMLKDNTAITILGGLGVDLEFQQHNYTPLHDAALLGHVDPIETLVKLKANLVETRNVYNDTPLLTAAKFGRVKVIEKLANIGADLEARNEHNQTPLHLAAGRGQVDAIETLIRLQADLEARDEYNQAPLHLAAGRGQVDAIETLVRLKADLKARDKFNRTPLHLAVDNGQVDAIETLARLKADLEARDDQGQTSLHLAANWGQVDAIETLARLKADLEARDEYDQTPLHLAAGRGQVDAIETLVRLKADLEARDKFNRTPLHLATDKGQVDAIETLIKLQADLEARDEYNQTPLHLAADRGRVDAIETLVRLKADLEARDDQGQTSLHLAANWGEEKAIETLAKVGANFEARNNFCKTSLHLAADKGQVNAMETLAQIGADLEARDNRGRTPLRLAEDGRRDLALKILGDLIKARLTRDVDVDIVNES